jgi:hypothetical protein
MQMSGADVRRQYSILAREKFRHQEIAQGDRIWNVLVNFGMDLLPWREMG